HPETRILGVDLQLPACRLPKNVTAKFCDQNDTKTLQSLAAAYGPFDVIIDDGSHFTRETRNCFQTLFATSLKVGGWYIIEDWAVGYWPDHDPRDRGMVELVTQIISQVPQLSISEFRLSLKPGKAFAAFHKGEKGWQF